MWYVFTTSDDYFEWIRFKPILQPDKGSKNIYMLFYVKLDSYLHMAIENGLRLAKILIHEVHDSNVVGVEVLFDDRSVKEWTEDRDQLKSKSIYT